MLGAELPDTEVVAPDDAALQQTDAPDQVDAEVDPPQTDVAEQADAAAKEAEKLTPEQKTIRQLQRRIDRLTAGRGAASREAELLREQLDARQQSQDDESKAIDPKDIDRLATEKARELVQQQTVATRAKAVMDSGKKLDKFDEAVNAVAEEVPFTDRQGRPSPFIEAVLDADKPAELLHWLGNNPDEAAGFANLTPSQIGRRIAKLEDRIEREGKAKTSNAPKPLDLTRGSAKGEKDPSSMTDAEFTAWRKKQIAQR